MDVRRYEELLFCITLSRAAHTSCIRYSSTGLHKYCFQSHVTPLDDALLPFSIRAPSHKLTEERRRRCWERERGGGGGGWGRGIEEEVLVARERERDERENCGPARPGSLSVPVHRAAHHLLQSSRIFKGTKIREKS